MNLIDREIEKFDKAKLKTMLGGYCWSQDGGDGGYDFDDIEEFIKSFLRSSLQRVIDETKEKCIEALAKEVKK